MLLFFAAGRGEGLGLYPSVIVVELESNTMTDLEENVARIMTWIEQWINDNEHREAEDGEQERVYHDERKLIVPIWYVTPSYARTHV